MSPLERCAWFVAGAALTLAIREATRPAPKPVARQETGGPASRGLFSVIRVGSDIVRPGWNGRKDGIQHPNRLSVAGFHQDLEEQ